MKILFSVPPSFKKFAIPFFNKSNYYFSSDPQGAKVGSGGGTINLLYNLYKEEHEQENSFFEWIKKEKRIVIHAGGESKRLPAYASVGKILTPIPVFRWKRGQHINQTLLDLQLPLLQEISNKAPASLTTLVASGDVLVRNEGDIPEIPEADIVCFGLWEHPEKALNHGVFFFEKSDISTLKFVLQKPDLAKMQELMSTYVFLIDIGIWLLSDKAIRVLSEKCGFHAGAFPHQYPGFYDLYSSLGEALGKNPTIIDEVLNELSVKIVPLDQGEFYHFGTSAELIESMGKLQRLEKNQQKIWHNKVKPHTDLYTQNADVSFPFAAQNDHIWIENSHVPASWKLKRKHLITGAPENDWDIDLPEGYSLDFIPVDEDYIAVRLYQFHQPQNPYYLHDDWYNNANIPVVNKKELSASLVQQIIDGVDENSFQPSISFFLAPHEVAEKTNLTRQFEQRNAFLKQNLPLISKNWRSSVFYQLDLKHVASLYQQFRLPLPPPLPEDASLFTRLHDCMFRSEVLKLVNGHSTADSEHYAEHAFTLLRDAILQEAQHHPVFPELNVLSDQIIWGRSPARLDLAGGWTDTPPFCLLNGGVVVNIAVELNGQPPLQVFIKPTEEFKIILRSIDLGAVEEIHSFSQLTDFTTVGSAFSIPKAALCLAGFIPAYCTVQYATLIEQLKDFGSGIEISLLSAIPKGSGLGTSSILAATVLGTLSDFCSLNWDKYVISHKTLILEQMLTTGGGWQDQFGGVFQGVKLLQSATGVVQHPTVMWAPDHIFKGNSASTILLYYTGITRVAKNILAEIVKGMFLNAQEYLDILEEMKSHAIKMYQAIQKGQLPEVAQLTAYSWELNKRLDSGTNTGETQQILDLIADHLSGAKLLGAGGGGYLLLFAKDIDAAAKIKEILNENPVNCRARFVDWQISETGFITSRS